MKRDNTTAYCRRPRRPGIAAPRNPQLAMPRVSTLSNGVKLCMLDGTGRGVARVSFVFRAGSVWQDKFFAASATANLLSEGTRSMSAQEVAEKLDFYGSYFDVNIDRDYAVITFCSLTRFLPRTLEVAGEILLRPAFPEREVETYCTKRRQSLAVERSKASVQARELFARALFGDDHPYGVSAPEECYDRLKRDDMEAFYAARYRAGNCFVVCSGDFGEANARLVAELAEAIPQGGGDELSMPEPHSTGRIFREREGAVQSAIRIGRLLFPRNHPDWVGMQVTSTVLGGYFGSRLVRNLREERGYTYGVFSAMVNLDRAGYLAIATEVGVEATADSVEQIFAEIERLRSELVSDEELSIVKNIMTGEVMRILDGPFGIADVTIENIQNGVDNTYLADYVARLREVTPGQVRDMAAKYLAREDFSTVIVGKY